MIDLRQVAQDPDFQALPDSEKIKALKELEPDMAQLPFNEQMKALKDLSAPVKVESGNKTKDTIASLLKSTNEGLDAISKPIPGIAPMAGAALGAAASGGNPIGGVLGYVGGKAGERFLQNKPTNISDVPKDVNEGMIQEIIAGIPNAMKPYAAKFVAKYFSKKTTPEMASNIKLSEDTGVPLSPAEIMQSKPAMLIESHLDKNIATAGESQRFREKQYDAINQLKEQLQSKFGGKTGTLEAGQLAQESGRANQGAWMSQAQKYYDAVPIKPDTPIETNNLRDIAIGHLDELGKMGNAGIKRILKIAEEGMSDNIPNYSWKELTADRAEVNKIIRMSSDPNKRRILHDVVNAIDDDISSFAQNNAPEVKQAFDKATSFYREGAKIFRDRQIANTLKSANPEDIVKTFIKPNNPSEIGRLSQAIGSHGMAPLKQAWLNKLVSAGEEQTFSPAKFATAFDKYDAATLKNFLSSDEITGLQQLSKMSKLLGKVEKVAGNPSGTGQTNITTGTIYALVRHPIIMMASLMGSKSFAKEYFTNPEFRNVFIKGIKMSPNASETSKLAARLAGIAGIQPDNEVK